MDEAKSQINDLDHKEAKNNQPEQWEENRIQKNPTIKWNLIVSNYFKTLVTKMLKELNKDLSSIKKDPVRNEGYTNWNKEQFTWKQQ